MEIRRDMLAVNASHPMTTSKETAPISPISTHGDKYIGRKFLMQQQQKKCWKKVCRHREG
ncbi:rCG59046 [Rattus norvegicus]|uniref:RCG59046 n=1 Tax=Rattus norvegicus TaxID=10116 RepID=A6JPT3_RAT|nr:rCG59046 [Rattus norvegicus]